MTKEELVKSFSQNEVSFKDAAVIILKYPEVIGIYNEIGVKEKSYFYHNINGIWIKSTSKIDTHVAEEIENRTLYVLRDLGFEKITTGSNGDIYFIKGSDLSTSIGILYIQNNNRPSDLYISDRKEIEENWYTFKS